MSRLKFRIDDLGVPPFAIAWAISFLLAFLIASTIGCGTRQFGQSDSKEPTQVVDGETPGGQASNETTVLPPMSISDMVDRFDDAVVFITVSDALGNDIAVGTGCIIDRSGLIATNRHVIENAVSARVQLRDQSRLPVNGCVAVDESHDLAIIKVDGMPESIACFALKPPPDLRPGDGLVAIGHPSEFRFTVSDGILSAIRQTDELPALYQQGLHLNPQTRWLQTTAAISNGSSGGPLLTNTGDLVGINTWVAGERNLGFAVSVDHLVQLSKEVSSPPEPLPLRDAPVIVGTTVASLSRDYYRELESFSVALRLASDQDAFIKLVQTRNPAPSSLAKCVTVMQKSESQSDKVDALLLAHEVWGSVWFGPQAGRRHLVKLYESVDENLARSEAIGRVALQLGNGYYCPELSAVLREIMRSHSHPSVRARAGLALVNVLGADRRAKRLIPEQIELLERLKSRYPDEEFGGVRLEDHALERLVRLQSLRVGATAQPLAGRDHLGSPIRLSDHDGEVVLLDFWSDGSPQCRSMYPQKRKLVEQLKDRPFALLGVNCDENSGRLESLVESGDVTWKNVYDGRDGRLAASWLVEDLPTTFVLDAYGIIRFTDVQDQQLAPAVHALLEESLVRFPQDIVPSGGQWKWHYDSEPPPDDWTRPDFDDSSWQEDQAPLGYGDSRVKTPLDYGDIDNKRLTACFRRQFNLGDPSSCERLICELDSDDGAIVYLNGVEVLRTNLPESASWTTPALLAADSPLVVELDRKHLVTGPNVLAVEVHQVDPHSADLIFDLSLSSRGLDCDSIMTAKSPHTRLRFCQLVAQLDGRDETLDQTLISMQEDTSDEVATWATVARIQRATRPSELVLPDVDEQRRQLWTSVSGELNWQAWEMVAMQNLCDQDAERAWRKSAAGWRLVETDETGYAGNAANTHGLALYRAGRFEEAITFFRKSMELGEKNPTDLAYLSLALNRIGADEEAREALAEAGEFEKHTTWPGEDAAAAAIEEARAALDPGANP